MILNQELVNFVLTVVFSFLLGLEYKAYREENNKKIVLGSTRTFTFLGIMGYVFYKVNINLYVAGFLAFSATYIAFYIYKLKFHKTGILTFLIASIIYSFGAFINLYSLWMPSLAFVIVIFTLNAKSRIREIVSQFNEKEFEILGKFVLLTAVVLPLLPHKNLSFINVSPFKIWLAVVVVSGISYLSYLLQKYFFKNKGFLIMGVLGGLYSSTATTVVLSKKDRKLNLAVIKSAIVLATGMMYLRLLVIAFIFNVSLATRMAVYFLALAAITTAVAFYFYKKDSSTLDTDDKNPLELQAAFLFAFLFVLMIVLTKFVSSHFGHTGIVILSFLIGFTDIDPYILSLLTGKYALSSTLLLKAIFIATGSNNILKAFYSLYFGGKNSLKPSIALVLLGFATMAAAFTFF